VPWPAGILRAETTLTGGADGIGLAIFSSIAAVLLSALHVERKLPEFITDFMGGEMGYGWRLES
jgi:hypothetical protein